MTLREGGRKSVGDDHESGDLGCDPLGLIPEDPERLLVMQTQKLKNWRLAMIAFTGMVAHGLVVRADESQTDSTSTFAQQPNPELRPLLKGCGPFVRAPSLLQLHRAEDVANTDQFAEHLMHPGLLYNAMNSHLAFGDSQLVSERTRDTFGQILRVIPEANAQMRPLMNIVCDLAGTKLTPACPSNGIAAYCGTYLIEEDAKAGTTFLGQGRVRWCDNHVLATTPNALDLLAASTTVDGGRPAKLASATVSVTYDDSAGYMACVCQAVKATMMYDAGATQAEVLDRYAAAGTTIQVAPAATTRCARQRIPRAPRRTKLRRLCRLRKRPYSDHLWQRLCGRPRRAVNLWRHHTRRTFEGLLQSHEATSGGPMGLCAAALNRVMVGARGTSSYRQYYTVNEREATSRQPRGCTHVTESVQDAVRARVSQRSTAEHEVHGVGARAQRTGDSLSDDVERTNSGSSGNNGGGLHSANSSNNRGCHNEVQTTRYGGDGHSHNGTVSGGDDSAAEGVGNDANEPPAATRMGQARPPLGLAGCGNASSHGDHNATAGMTAATYSSGTGPDNAAPRGADCAAVHQIFVRPLAGRTMTVCIRSWDASVREVSAQIYSRHRTPAHQQRRVFAGKQLMHGDYTLADYGIREGSTLELLGRLCGGLPAKGDTSKGDTAMTPAEGASTVATASNSSLLAWAKWVQEPYQALLKSAHFEQQLDEWELGYFEALTEQEVPEGAVAAMTTRAGLALDTEEATRAMAAYKR